MSSPKSVDLKSNCSLSTQFFESSPSGALIFPKYTKLSFFNLSTTWSTSLFKTTSVSLAKLSWEIPRLFKLNLINLSDSCTDNFVKSLEMFSKLSNLIPVFLSIMFFAISIK